MCNASQLSTHSVRLHVVPKQQTPHIVLSGGWASWQVLEHWREVLLELVLYQRLEQTAQVYKNTQTCTTLTHTLHTHTLTHKHTATDTLILTHTHTAQIRKWWCAISLRISSCQSWTSVGRECLVLLWARGVSYLWTTWTCPPERNMEPSHR